MSLAFASVSGVFTDSRPSVKIAVAVAGVLFVWTVFSTWRQYSRLSHFKGPLLASLSKWWLIKTVGNGRAYLDFWEINKKYGQCHPQLQFPFFFGGFHRCLCLNPVRDIPSLLTYMTSHFPEQVPSFASKHESIDTVCR